MRLAWVVFDLTRILAALALVLVVVFGDPQSGLAFGLVVFIFITLMISIIEHILRHRRERRHDDFFYDYL